MPQDTFGYAAEKQVRQAVPAVRAHHDPINAPLGSGLHNLLRHVADAPAGGRPP